MKNYFKIALLGLLAVPSVLLAETPQQVQAWYDAEVRKAEANLADAEALAKANPNSPSMQMAAQRIRQNHANLLMMLQREYQRRMQQAQQGNSAGGAILPPLPPMYASGTDAVLDAMLPQGGNGKSPLGMDINPNPTPTPAPNDPTPITVDTQVADLYKSRIQQYKTVLVSFRNVKDAATADYYIPGVYYMPPLVEYQWDPKRGMAVPIHRDKRPMDIMLDAHNELQKLYTIEQNMRRTYSDAVVNNAAKPYIGEVSRLEKEITAEILRIINHLFYGSWGCESFIRKWYGYNGPTINDPSLKLQPVNLP